MDGFDLGERPLFNSGPPLGARGASATACPMVRPIQRRRHRLSRAGRPLEGGQVAGDVLVGTGVAALSDLLPQPERVAFTRGGSTSPCAGG